MFTAKRSLALAVLIAAACAAPAPPPAPQPVPEQPAPAPAEEKPIAKVRVTASLLNVRKDSSLDSAVIGHARRGDRLDLLSFGDEWDRVRLPDGTAGYVSVLHVIRIGSQSRKGCPADAEFSFVKTPTPSFSDNATAHGIVSVDATVSAKGDVIATKVISNTTGDESLGPIVEREIRQAKFIAPIRNCVAKPFIFTYKRSF